MYFLLLFSLQNQDETSADNENSKSASVADNGETQYSVPKRRPFHYNSLKDPLHTSHDRDMAARYQRYRYISKLSGHNMVRKVLNYSVFFHALSPRSNKCKA